jgi:serine/threonine-protein kinase
VTPNLRLVRPLGHGGMGVLWIAQHRTLDSEVVVKFLSDELADDAAAAERFAREAAAAARVKSPHVVQILDYGVTASATPFIVMELLEGRDLGAHIEVHGALSREETTAVVHQLAKALMKTHAAGLVHRDVKPSNIFLCDGDGDLFVKLLDFGIAKRAPSAEVQSTGSGRCVGTPRYMSPEQIVGDGVDARSDLWSLGVVAFECLTAKRPFEGETLGALALAIHTLPLPRPTDVMPSLPPEMDAWFARACARPVEERFASAIEAAESLARALGVDVRATRAPVRDVDVSPPAIESTGTRPLEDVAERAREGDRLEGERALPGAGRAWGLWIAATAAATIVAAGAYRARTSEAEEVRTTASRIERAAPSPRAEIEPPLTRFAPREETEAGTSSAASPRLRAQPPTPRVALGIAAPAESSPAPSVADAGAGTSTLRDHLYEMPDERH